MIAILSNTYQIFDKKASGLFLSKILTSRDDMAFDENYGAFLLTMTPINVVVLPFVPYAIMTKPSAKLNKMIMILQYSVFIVICYIVFLIGSICLIPLAYFKSISSKFQGVMKLNNIIKKLMGTAECLIYILIGIPLLVLGLVSDFYYFWANNFRSNLKQIIIVKKKSHLTIDSIKMLTVFCNNYNKENVKALNAVKTVVSFR
jgi:hypothetical protein